jgi:hypothetical protein
MGIKDILQQYADRPTDTHQDFNEVAREIPKDVLADGMAHAMRSDQTPPFGQLIGQLFGQSNPQQRAGILGELARAAGPGVLGKLGGLFGGGNAAGSGGSTAAPATITPADAQQVSPQQAEDIARAAEKQDPGVLDRVAGFYAEHPEVFKAVGGMALALALGRMAQRNKG